MKYMDLVKIIKDDKKYAENNVYKGRIGRIVDGEIRDNCFHIAFDTGREDECYDFCIIKIKDLELVKDCKFTDKQILTSLPKNNPHWWCKVENGYILNLLGEKKNKIPYDYDS